METKSLVKIAKALSDPSRLRLLQEIARAPEVPCTSLFAVVPVSQPTMSHHLKVLEEAGLIAIRKEGRALQLSFLAGQAQLLEGFLAQLRQPA